MYFQYSFNASATPANLVQDIAAIICGETDPNNLSTGCDIAGSNAVATTIPTTWTVHDSAAGASKIVVKAPDADGYTTKFVVIEAISTAVYVYGIETWNAVTHAGTNSQQIANPLVISAGVPGRFMILVSPRYICVEPNPASPGTPGHAVFEISRDTPILDSTYPCTVTSSLGTGSYSFWSAGGAKLSRIKNPKAAGDILPATLQARRIISTYGPVGQYSPNLGISGVAWYPVEGNIKVALFESPNTDRTYVGTILGGILQMETGSTLSYTSCDEIDVSGTRYVMLKITAYGVYGTMAILIPRG